MSVPERVLLLAQPMLFATAVVLYRALVIPTPAVTLMHPVAVALVIAVAALLVARIVTRSWVWSSLWASLFVVFTLREAIPTGVLAAFFVWWAILLVLRRATGRPPPSEQLARRAARASSIFAVAFLAVAVGSALAAFSSRPELTLPSYEATGSGGPNVYLILLDAYPRADTLQETFGIDNAAFVADLEELGFDVSDTARSNYNKTWLALGSMLSGAYVSDLLRSGQEVPEGDPAQIRWLRPLIDDGAFLDLAQDRGYRIRTVAPPITSAALLSADEYVDPGNLTEFEANFLWSSPWTLLLRDIAAPLFLASHEQSVKDGLAVTASMARQHESPQLVLAHIQSPHPPFVLHQPEAPAPEPMPCFPAECSLWQSTIGELTIELDEYRDALAAQLPALNMLVLHAVREITVADPGAVVVLFSDHGIRYSLEDTDEHFKAFLAARTPGVDELYPEDESTVNLLRRLAAAYWDVPLEPLPYRAWWSDWNATLDLSPYPFE